MKIGIHQPNYIPWCGYFYKIFQSDIFVFLDDAQYEKNGYSDRNTIKTPQGQCYLKIPVKKEGLTTTYNDTFLKDELRWREKHLKTIEMNYKRTSYYDEIMPYLKELYYAKCSTLSEFNINVISELSYLMGLKTRFVRSSELEITGRSTERLINIIQSLNGDTYISGNGAIKYQDEKLFKENKIILQYSNFLHPIYEQQWGGFLTNLSILDILFNNGLKKTAEIIENSYRN